MVYWEQSCVLNSPTADGRKDFPAILVRRKKLELMFWDSLYIFGWVLFTWREVSLLHAKEKSHIGFFSMHLEAGQLGTTASTPPRSLPLMSMEKSPQERKKPPTIYSCMPESAQVEI